MFMLYRHAFLPTLVPADKIKLAPFSTLLFFPFRYLDPFSLHVRCLPFASGLVLPNHTLLDIKNGVRGLMLDTYDFNNDVWLCHSFQGKCFNFTAFQPAINVLKEIRTFLDGNPSEVITIFLEDYTASGSLPKVFNASGLMKYWFPVAKMPKSGGDWPLLKDMISQNERLLVFTSKKSKEASEGIAYEWSYVVENQYGNEGMVEGKCPNRAESPAMDSKSQSLVLMNFFTTDPSQTGVCANNSAPLVSMLKTCHDLSGNRWPNYIAVDFYMRSDGGGAPLATDIANGHLVCGCDNIAYCKANSTFGTCVIPPPSPPPSPRKAPSGGKGTSAGGSSSSSGAMARVVLPKLSFFFGVALLILVILSY
ncbi:PI-PLC X domain-containing protein At5g67130 isoform X2 [Oryza sativa Japonica Group]|uniref:PI-PLC X domain-containing protein At5g67130 isoform X2 n=1 Tax=Oryza sativa subsp. japonica TaxID=39947 RepID=UPI000E1B8218|nr:PI-PLC X domain-containing protein At5g67130 isoform X2 [Oryza sativa Japonica Group]